MSDELNGPIEDAPLPIPVRHVGPRGCGRIAFFLTEKPAEGDYLSSGKARHGSGKPVAPYEKVSCDHCGCNDLWPLLDEQGWPVVVTRPRWTTDCVGCIELEAQ
jgi:hypothetical protein